MRALDRKLLRDFWGMKGQAAAIALVIASGVATYVMSVSTLDSLRSTRAVYYRDYRFAEVFASLKRAPESLKRRIEAIPGVHLVETRVAAGITLDLAGFPDPVTGQMISIPDEGQPLLNQLYIKQGRLPQANRYDEVLISDPFSKAQKLLPGDELHATINGRRKRLRIAGVALSPEFIYQLQPGAIIPDFETFGVLWMPRTPLESAYDMTGAFNDVVISISAGFKSDDVVAQLDQVLVRYGGLGAYGRENQVSHRYLSEEFRGLEQMATMFPTIFLGVAAFLLNVVIGRLMATQREQVAILKAFGYTISAIAVHYLKLIVLIVLVGVAGGVAFGAWLGMGLSRMYMDFYRFPFLVYELQPRDAVTAGLISAAAAVLGTLYAVIRAAVLPPAQAMQPAPPAHYRRSIIEWLGVARRLTQPSRMIIRNIERRPIKALLSAIGVAFSCAILVTGGFFSDAIDYMVAIHFRIAQTDDITVTFVEPTSRKALYSLASVRGVEHVEPFRSVPARLRFEHRSYRTSIQGLPAGGTLHRLLDRNLRDVELPAEGLLMTDHLAKILGVRPGDTLTVEVLEGSRPVLRVPVTSVVSEWVGVSGYMRLSALNRLMREGSAISGAYMSTDARHQREIYSELKMMPRIAGTTVREKALRNFYDTMARQMLTFAFFNTLLASTIAFGVVYNSARISFSERSRELASLRVLGYTRAEIGYILLGELGLLTLIALPAGCFIGRMLCAYYIAGFQTDLYRIPLVIDPATYSFATTVVLASAIVSSWMIKRKLDRLDLVAVLKTKE
jgi:putative ABC transport system permease protein